MKFQKGTVTFILTICVVIVALGLIGFNFYKNGRIIPLPNRPVSPTPVTDPTLEWKTYRNEKYGIETRFHADSIPTEVVGNEDAGQFTYLLLVNFGNVPLKSQYGYTLEINRQKTLENYRKELIGHITDNINSEEDVVINNYEWTKYNYDIFLTTDNIPVTLAVSNHGKYGYAITASALDIDIILATVRFLDPTITPVTDESDRKTCINCPLYTPPHPDWCTYGTIVAGEDIYFKEDNCYCPGPPECKPTF